MARRMTSTITAKLFYLITSLVVLIVVGMTIQSTNKYKVSLTQAIQDGALSQAERAATDISTQVDGTIAKVSVTLPKISTLSDGKGNSSSEFRNLLRNDPEILAASVFLVDKDKPRQIISIQSPYPNKVNTDNRYLGKSPSEVKAKVLTEAVDYMNSANLQIVNQKSAILTSLANETGLPIMLLVIKFDFDSSSDQKIYVALALWQTRILVALPKSKSMHSIIVDGTGKIFASTDISDAVQKKNLSNIKIVKSAISKNSPSGFQDVYLDSNNVEKLGAFSQVTGFSDLYVIVERDANSAFQVISKSYYSSILWAVLFVLIAILASYIGAGSATRSIRDLLSVTKQISTGNFSARVQLNSSDEIAELGQSVNHMAAKITDLLSTQIEKARFEKELETARMVQSTFFPKQDVNEGPLTVTGFYQPATECGGDLWGHYNVSSNKQILFIADAMGHGAPAALVTAIGYATCQAVAAILKDEPNLNSTPSLLLDRLNKIIFDAVEGKISMTFFAALFDFEAGTVTFSNAGHNFPLIISNNADDNRVSKNAKSKSKNKESSTYAIPLQLQGTPLGVDRSAVYTEKTMEICPGDKLFLFTDGLIENHLESNAPFGRKALVEHLTTIGDSDIIGMKDNVLQKATSIFGDSNLADDVTIVVAEIDRNWKKSQKKAPDLKSENLASTLSATEPSPIPKLAVAELIEQSVIQKSEIDLEDLGTESKEHEPLKFKIKLPGAI